MSAIAYPRDIDEESSDWITRLHAGGAVRAAAVAELYELLRREAAFHIRSRVASVSRFPRSDIDDLAAQAAGDALVALVRKLDDYRGDSRFWTWAKRFVELEAPVSIRRRLGRDCVGISRDPEALDDVIDSRRSVHERVEARELIRTVGVIVATDLTERQRTVLAASLNDVPAACTAKQLETSPGAVYKCLHDVRVKVRSLTDPA